MGDLEPARVSEPGTVVTVSRRWRNDADGRIGATAPGSDVVRPRSGEALWPERFDVAATREDQGAAWARIRLRTIPAAADTSDGGIFKT